MHFFSFNCYLLKILILFFTALVVNSPTNVLAGDTLSLTLTWDANPEADIKYYTLKWGTTRGVYPNSVRVNAPSVVAKATGLIKGVTYYLVVNASNDFSTSADSDVLEVKYAPSSAPKAPTATWIPQSTGLTLNLSWPANPEPDVEEYILKWGTSPGVYSSTQNMENNLTATLTGLQKNTKYYFALSAINITGLESPNSSEVMAEFVEKVTEPKVSPYQIDASTFKVQPNGQMEMVVNGVPGGYCILQTSYDLTTWYELDELIFDTDKAIKVMIQPPKSGKAPPKQFFRIKWEEE